MIAHIEELMRHDTAGDPMTGQKWTRKTTAKVAIELKSLGIEVSPKTVARLLHNMGFALRANQKKVSNGNPVDRDKQFRYISELRDSFSKRGEPIISVDTKKKELVGNFKNSGTTWNRRPALVNDHDFPSMAEGKAVPYGIYDVEANRGSVFVGMSYDTPEFATEAIEDWWSFEGSRRYPHASNLLILADGGGSNGPNPRAWKHGLQNKLCDRHGLTITVSHYPAGASKWNPIEHRLFSEISKNWAGHPLDSYETILGYIASTTTSTGLKVKPYLVQKDYRKGVKIPDAEMKQLALHPHDVLPKRNYTLCPR